jgi:hypothetical protein
VRRLGELDIGVADDLDAVASGVEKIEERTGQRLDGALRIDSLSSTTRLLSNLGSPRGIRQAAR